LFVFIVRNLEVNANALIVQKNITLLKKRRVIYLAESSIGKECEHFDFVSADCGCLICAICEKPMDSRECEIGHKDGILA